MYLKLVRQNVHFGCTHKGVSKGGRSVFDTDRFLHWMPFMKQTLRHLCLLSGLNWDLLLVR